MACEDILIAHALGVHPDHLCAVPGTYDIGTVPGHGGGYGWSIWHFDGTKAFIKIKNE